MSQEKLKILEMIEKNIISPKEGADLLKAVDQDSDKESIKVNRKEAFKMLKIRVNSSDGDKVNVTIPLEFAKIALRSKKGIPKLDQMNVDLDFDHLIDMIESGTEGKIVDIQSNDGDNVEIFIE